MVRLSPTPPARVESSITGTVSSAANASMMVWRVPAGVLPSMRACV